MPILLEERTVEVEKMTVWSVTCAWTLGTRSGGLFVACPFTNYGQ